MPLSNKSSISYTVLFLAALSLMLATIDASIPKPIPFLRIGLANFPILLALFLLPAHEYFMLVLIKSLGMSIISGTILSYVALFSIAGSFASAGIMWILNALLSRHISFLGLATAGALASNSIQLILARYLIFGSSVQFMIPLFLFAGLASGLLLGIFSLQFARKSQWLKKFAHSAREDIDSNHNPSVGTNNQHTLQTDAPALADVNTHTSPKTLSWYQIGSLAVIVAVILVNSLLISAIGFIIAFAITMYLARKNNNKFPSLIMPMVVIAGITLVHILVPRGRVLLALPGIPITENALLSGLKSGFFLEALIMLSKIAVNANLTLPGKLGRSIAQLFNLYKLFFSTMPELKHHAIITGIDDYLLSIETQYALHSLTYFTDNIII